MPYLQEQRDHTPPACASSALAHPATILHVSTSLYDHQSLEMILRHTGWKLHTVPTLGAALRHLRAEALPVVISECELPDGNWHMLVEGVGGFPAPPRVIVLSRLADERIWAEVLHLGAFDLISHPLDLQEVRHVITHAWGSWHREWTSGEPRRSRPKTAGSAPAL